MNPELSNAITALMQLLYGQNRQGLSKDDLLALRSTSLGAWIEPAIEKLRQADLIAAGFLETSIKRTGPGLKAFLSNTYLALALGKNYVLGIAKSAIVHVVVSGKKDKPTGGTGFYCADVGNRLVTAAHNVEGREILKVDDGNEKVFHAPPINIQSIIKGLDLAILDVVAPEGTHCLDVEWDKDEILPLSPLYVVGFPQIPMQVVVPMTHRSTELAGSGLDQKRRETYLIQNVTSPGFSGGPAINLRGRVVGVVQGIPDAPSSTIPDENKQNAPALDPSEIQKYDTDYSVLTPAFLLEELEPSLIDKKLVIASGDSFI